MVNRHLPWRMDDHARLKLDRGYQLRFDLEGRQKGAVACADSEIAVLPTAKTSEAGVPLTLFQ